MAIQIPGPVRRHGRSDPESWAHYLDPGERLLWQGAPAGGVRVGAADVPGILFGCVILGFALFWTAMAAILGDATGTALDWAFPLFGLPFIAIGAFQTVGRFFWEARQRRRTRYALTSRRAMIARSVLGRSLRSYPIAADVRVDYRPGPEATIWFAEEERRDGKGRRHTARHGFERIAEGNKVYRMMCRIQQQDADRLEAERRETGRRDVERGDAWR